MRFHSLASAAAVQRPSTRGPLHASHSGDSGMVTAETAVVLPVFVLVLAVMVAVVGYSVDSIRVIDAAKSGARLAARGEPIEVVRQQAEEEAPDGASVYVSFDDDEVRVSVVSPGRTMLGPLGLPAAEAEAVALIEISAP